MKPVYLLAVALFLLGACKKNKKQDPVPLPPPTGESIGINGKIYPTVTLDNKVWTAENYSGAGGLEKQGKPGNGKYYTFTEAAAITLPAGWRLPTEEEYIEMAKSQGVIFTNNRADNQEAIRKLTSINGWLNVAGSNTSGFNAFPAGYMYHNGDPMDGDIAEFWTSTGNTMSIQETAKKSLRMVFYSGSSDGAYRFNVRFIKDR